MRPPMPDRLDDATVHRLAEQTECGRLRAMAAELLALRAVIAAGCPHGTLPECPLGPRP